MKSDVEIGCDTNDWLKRGALEITALRSPQKKETRVEGKKEGQAVRRTGS